MFPNKILVKIDDLCEKPGNKSAVFTEFHRLKMNIEDPFTQVEFFGMFSIKNHHFCKKNYKKSLKAVFWNHFLPLPDLPFFPRSWQSQFTKSIQTKIIFEVRKDQSQDLDYYIFDFQHVIFHQEELWHR